MNSRDIIKANLEHSGAPRPGMTFDRGRMNDVVCGGPGDPAGYTQKRWTEGIYEYYDDIWGNLWHRMKEGCQVGEVCKPIIEDWSQLKDLKIPQFDRKLAAECYKKSFDKSPELFRIAFMPGWIFAQARYMRKMEIYLMDMALYPDELHILHEKMAPVYETVIAAASDAGADAICFAEDLGTETTTLFSPDMWQDYFGPLYKKLFDQAHEGGLSVWMHSCGQNRGIIEHLLNAGVNCFQFDQPAIYDFADLSSVLKKYRAALWSPVDIQKVLPTGDRKLIESSAEAMFKSFNGFLICKNYPDLPGIGVKDEWDDWAYNKFVELSSGN